MSDLFQVFFLVVVFFFWIFDSKRWLEVLEDFELFVMLVAVLRCMGKICLKSWERPWEAEKPEGTGTSKGRTETCCTERESERTDQEHQTDTVAKDEGTDQEQQTEKPEGTDQEHQTDTVAKDEGTDQEQQTEKPEGTDQEQRTDTVAPPLIE